MIPGRVVGASGRRRATTRSGRSWLGDAARRAAWRTVPAALRHELRTPLHAIVGYSKPMGMGTPDTFERPGPSRPSSGTRAPGPADRRRPPCLAHRGRQDRSMFQPIELPLVIQNAVSTVPPWRCQGRANRARGRPARRFSVSAIPARLQQVVWNLLDERPGAFTPKLGRVQVRVERVTSHIEVVARADTGVGIAPEFLPMFPSSPPR